MDVLVNMHAIHNRRRGLRHFDCLHVFLNTWGRFTVVTEYFPVINIPVVLISEPSSGTVLHLRPVNSHVQNYDKGKLPETSVVSNRIGA